MFTIEVTRVQGKYRYSVVDKKNNTIILYTRDKKIAQNYAFKA